VIGGFYWIALRNASVGSSIFVGDSGLQFITLFSLVIAIILFGLTEVLQGRELAALLGGISGYILGRSSRGTQASGVRPSAESEEEPAGGPAGRASGEDANQGAVARKVADR
jgi:hypothetical protein